jgi:chorismate mutase/prephenate dehydratase
VSDPDPVVTELRAEITELDRQLLATINRRLEVVRRLHEHKEVTGMPLRDLDREVTMLRALEAENPGPLSAEGVASFFSDVLELIRQEQYGD